MIKYDYNRWKNFTKRELICRFSGKENPNVAKFSALMDRVQELRDWYGKPLKVTSAYRHPTHPRESCKDYPGPHTIAAIDIQVPVEDCYKVLDKVFEMGFTGIGINLAGDHKSRFIHLDQRREPRVWSYK